jgi:hypothetical protein
VAALLGVHILEDPRDDARDEPDAEPEERDVARVSGEGREGEHEEAGGEADDQPVGDARDQQGEGLADD